MGSRRFVVDEATATASFLASSSVHTIRSSAAVSGWFDADIEGGRFGAASSISGHLEIPVEGLSSGNPIIDREMRRRAGSDRHLQIVGDIESTLEIETTCATITGMIDFFGESELVEGEIRLLSGPRIAGIGEFDVRWWGFEPPKFLMLRVDPIVTVEIDLPLSYNA